MESADQPKQIAFPDVRTGGSADPPKAGFGRRSFRKKELHLPHRTDPTHWSSALDMN